MRPLWLNLPTFCIARSGVDMEELDKKFTGTELEALKGSLAQVEQETRLKKRPSP